MLCDLPGWLSLIGERPRGQVAQRRVRSLLVVVDPPLLDPVPSVRQREEPGRVQAFCPQPGVEASINALSVGVPGLEKSISTLFR